MAVPCVRFLFEVRVSMNDATTASTTQIATIHQRFRMRSTYERRSISCSVPCASATPPMVRDGALGEHITVGRTINVALVTGTKATLIAASLWETAHRSA